MSITIEKTKRIDEKSKKIEERLNIDKEIDNVVIEIKKKKGRPRKNPITEIQPTEEVEKKKRGRKKKEKVEEEVKIKKKRGRKAALKFFSSTIRKKMPLTASIQDNDKSILHLNIKEEESSIDLKKITYDVLKNEYSSIPKINKDGNLIWDSSDKELHTEINEINKNEINKNENNFDENDVIYNYIEQNDETKVDVEELYEKQLEIRSKQDENLIKKLENLHKNDNLINKLISGMDKKISTSKLNKTEDDTSNKGYSKILKDFVENEVWIENTNVCCWWCCHTFNSVPIGIPIDYNIKSNKFRVKGIFCSFACLLAYKKLYQVYSHKTSSLIAFMYKKLTGGLIQSKDNFINILSNRPFNELFGDNTKLKEDYINSLSSFIDTPLEKAPDRCTLKMFGGHLSIDEFRNSVKERKIYKMIEYPLCISRDYIEEVDLQKVKNVNMSFFNKNKNQNLYIERNQHQNHTEKQIEEAKERVTNNNFVVTNNSIDRFIKFN